MLFHTYQFWLFFLVVLLAYRRLGHRGQNRLLLLASYVFYGSWDARFLALIVGSTALDFVVARRLAGSEDEGRRRAWLGVSLAANLGALGFFKYWNFFVGEASALLSSLGLGGLSLGLDVVLPVGISFYTFQTMSYTIDVYRGELEPVDDPLDFALYVCFFPQLVAGPIERAADFLPQVLGERPGRAGDFSAGLYLVVLGLFKKVVVGDGMAGLANAVFAAPPGALAGSEVVAGVYAFAFQIYGDFSGYSSMARGMARWLGFDLSVNFRMPYFAATPSEFWRRWHVSLSSWLRDYLYIPLGGNRGGPLATQRNLALTMLLGGLWHGAGWTFLAWGALHGALLIAYRPFEGRGGIASWRGPRRVVATLAFFHAVCLAWLFFRAEDLGHAAALLGRLGAVGAPTGLAVFVAAQVLLVVGPLVAYELWVERQGDLLAMTRRPTWLQAGFYLWLTLSLITLAPARQYEFLYFQF